MLFYWMFTFLAREELTVSLKPSSYQLSTKAARHDKEKVNHFYENAHPHRLTRPHLALDQLRTQQRSAALATLPPLVSLLLQHSSLRLPGLASLPLLALGELVC